MPDLTTIQDAIRTRLAELEELLEPLLREVQQLKDLAAGFGDGGGRAAELRRVSGPRAGTAHVPQRRARATSSTTGAKRGRPRGSGNRARQALAKIAEQPGITAGELAGSMGIATNYLYRVLPQLERDGKVTKRGRGYHPSGASEGERSTPWPQP